MKRVLVIVLAVILLVGGSCGVVSLFRSLEWQCGRAAADIDWKAGRAVLYAEDGQRYSDSSPDHYFDHSYDRETGLLIRQKRRDGSTSFYDGYGAAVAKLLSENGVPSWSMRDHLIPDEELLAAIKSPALKQIPKFPCEVTDSLVIVSGGTFSRWGYTSSGTGPRIETRQGLMMVVGSGNEPIYVGRSSDPHVVLIRAGKKWVGAFHEDGREISYLSVIE